MFAAILEICRVKAYLSLFSLRKLSHPRFQTLTAAGIKSFKSGNCINVIHDGKNENADSKSHNRPEKAHAKV